MQAIRRLVHYHDDLFLVSVKKVPNVSKLSTKQNIYRLVISAAHLIKIMQHFIGNLLASLIRSLLRNGLIRNKDINQPKNVMSTGDAWPLYFFYLVVQSHAYYF